MGPPAGGSYDPPRAAAAGPLAVAPALSALPAELVAELGAVAPDLAGALGEGWAAWHRRARERGDSEPS